MEMLNSTGVREVKAKGFSSSSLYMPARKEGHQMNVLIQENSIEVLQQAIRMTDSHRMCPEDGGDLVHGPNGEKLPESRT